MYKYSKVLIFFLCLWPIYSLSYYFYFNQLGPDPIKKIMHHFGEWSLIFICLTLAMTPLQRITISNVWVRHRRMLGLFVFFYVSVHLLVYVGLDYRFDWNSISDDLIKKKYIYIGFSAWLLLIPLALTSSQKMMIKLKSNWKKLHRLIYVIAAFGILHFIWMSKTIFFEPLIYLIIIVVLFLFRIKIRRST